MGRADRPLRVRSLYATAWLVIEGQQLVTSRPGTVAERHAIASPPERLRIDEIETALTKTRRRA